MAVRFNAAAESLTATASLPSITAFTVMGWFNANSFSSLSSASIFFRFGDATGSNAYYIYTTSGASANPIISTGTSNSFDGGTNLNTNQWYHVAMVVRGTGAGQVEGWFDGVQNSAVTADGNASNTAGKLWIGSDALSETFDGRVAFVKVWGAALPAAEIVQEMRVGRPVRLANLWGFFPMFPGSGERTRDYSGLGNTLTENGTLTDEDPPPVSYGVETGWMLVTKSVALTQTLLPTGISTVEALGAASLSLALLPTGISTTEAEGSPSFSQIVTFSGLTSAESIGALTLSEVIAFSGIPSAEAFGTSGLSFIMYLDGLGTAEAMGAFVVQNAGELFIGGIPSGETFGQPVVDRGPAFVLPPGIASAEAIGTLALSMLILPSGIASGQATGTPTIAVGPAFILPTGIASGGAFGIAAFTLANNVTLSGIISAEAFGTPVFGVFMRLDGIASGELFGMLAIAGLNYILPLGITSLEAFGIPGSGADSAIARELGTYVEYTFKKVEVPA